MGFDYGLLAEPCGPKSWKLLVMTRKALEGQNNICDGISL